MQFLVTMSDEVATLVKPYEEMPQPIECSLAEPDLHAYAGAADLEDLPTEPPTIPLRDSFSRTSLRTSVTAPLGFCL